MEYTPEDRSLARLTPIELRRLNKYGGPPQQAGEPSLTAISDYQAQATDIIADQVISLLRRTGMTHVEFGGSVCSLKK